MISTVHVLCSIRSSSPGYHLFLQVLSSDRVSCFHCSSFRILHWRKKKNKNKKTQSDMTALGFSCWLNKGCNQWLWSSLIRQQFQSEHTVLRAQDRIDHCLHTGLQPKTPKNQWDNKYKANKTRHLYLRSIQLCRLIIVIVSVIAHIQTQLVSIKMRYFRKCSLL